MRNRLTLLASLTLLAISLHPAIARASEIVDQSYTGPTPGILPLNGFSPVGQNFTPTLSGIDFAVIEEAVGSGVLNITVNQGFNGGTQVLGTTGNVAISGSGIYELDFPSTIALTPGAPYSLVFNTVSGSLTLSDGKATGAFIDGGSGFIATSFYFQEGINTSIPAATPEPSSFVLLGTGVLSLAGAARRRFVKA